MRSTAPSTGYWGSVIIRMMGLKVTTTNHSRKYHRRALIAGIALPKMENEEIISARKSHANTNGMTVGNHKSGISIIVKMHHKNHCNSFAKSNHRIFKHPKNDFDLYFFWQNRIRSKFTWSFGSRQFSCFDSIPCPFADMNTHSAFIFVVTSGEEA